MLSSKCGFATLLEPPPGRAGRSPALGALNIEDTHLVTYSPKKPDGHKLLTSGRRGSEKTMGLTPRGEETVQRYRKVREALLVKSVKSAGMDEQRLSEIAALMRALSGHYDQAARAAASL
jgi:predicted MarR family transcription regulator